MGTFELLLFAGWLAGQQAPANSRATAEDIAAGAQTFRSHCAPCHGLRGEGGRGPNLSSGHFYHGSSDQDLLRNISEGIPGTEMPGIFYTEDRLRQVIAYLRSLNASAGRPPGNAARGAVLFQLKGCPGCHRVQGAGGRLGPDLSQVGKMRSLEHLRQSIVDPSAEVVPRYWVATLQDSAGKRVEGFVLNQDTYTVQLMDMSGQLLSYDKSTIRDYKVEKISKMPSYRSSLAGEQLDDLVSYLASLRP